MKHNPKTSLGEAQSDGPSPWLLSPQATLLPGLGPRPSSSWSWSLPWGCNTEKVPTGGPFGYTLLQMGAAPDFRTCREGGEPMGQPRLPDRDAGKLLPGVVVEGR